MYSVFITNGQSRQSLAIVRALGQKGIKVTVGSHKRFNPAAHSRWASDKVRYPSPETNPEKFMSFMMDYLARNPHDVIIPTIDKTCDIVIEHLDQLSAHTKIALPARAVYEQARDKGKTITAAEKSLIPHPKTYQPKNAKKAQTATKELGYPLIIKARKGSGSQGIAIVTTERKFPRAYDKINKQFPQPLVQEYIPAGGGNYGTMILVDKNQQPQATFAYRSIREFPLRGGIGSLYESCYLPKLIKHSLKVLKQIKWVGFAQLDFRVDPRDGEAKIMEINPRFPASLCLATQCGIDFPFLLTQQLMKQPLDNTSSYSAGRLSRWLIPGDILHFLTSPDRFKLCPSFFDFSGSQDGLLSIRDPLPTGVTIMYMLSRGFRPEVLSRLATRLR